MKKFLIGTAAVLLMSATAFAQDGGGSGGDGGSGQRGLDLARDSFPGLGAMRQNQGDAIQPSGDIGSSVGALNDPGNGGTYPQSGPQAYVPRWGFQPY